MPSFSSHYKARDLVVDPPSQCIFCKSTSPAFTAIEYIVPESLGNTEHVLPRGVVCDPCNNYFACKVEGPIRSSEFFRSARSRNGIRSKRNRVPTREAFSLPLGVSLEFGVAKEGFKYVCPSEESDNSVFKSLVRSRQRFSAYFPPARLPDTRLFARFLLLMGLEALAQIMLPVEDGVRIDHIENSALDEAGEFTRFNRGAAKWPFHKACLYKEGHQFFDKGESYDVPHEYTILRTEPGEAYFVIAIFGIQYTINLGGPELDGFLDWLDMHDAESPLYPCGSFRSVSTDEACRRSIRKIAMKRMF